MVNSSQDRDALLSDLHGVVKSFETLQLALMEAEASATQVEGEVMASGLFAMRYTATLMMRQARDYRYCVEHGIKVRLRWNPSTSQSARCSAPSSAPCWPTWPPT